MPADGRLPVPAPGSAARKAEALLILGVPAALRELGLEGALTAAHRQIQVTAGLAAPTLVHLDMPRWFGGPPQEAPCLRELAQALRQSRKLAFRYRSAEARNGEHRDGEPRVVGPLGLVNKAGTWYLVAMPGPGDIRVFRAARVLSARVLPEAFGRPAGFELAAFWARWSAEFEVSRPRLQVRLRASPQALAWIPEVLARPPGPRSRQRHRPAMTAGGWSRCLSSMSGRPRTGWLASATRSRSSTRRRSGPGCWPRPARSSDATMLSGNAHRN